MLSSFKGFVFFSVFIVLSLFSKMTLAQSMGAAGSVSGTVTDPSGAVVSGATVTVENVATGYKRSTETDARGVFRFSNIPPNSYSFRVSASGFGDSRRVVEVRTLVPVVITIPLSVSSSTDVVTVSGVGDVIENVPSMHTDIDRSLIARLPIRGTGYGLNDVITFAAPGVVGDSNGFFHPLGDHAQSSIIIDGQPITDQQSKAFSNQLVLEAVQSLEVTTGAPAAEYGDKTSLVTNAVTRSGLGLPRPTGSFISDFGSFGTYNNGGTLGFGNKKFGNFTAFSATRSGRFLDPPETASIHNVGTSFNLFNRSDWQVTGKDTLRLNVSLARTQYQVPNTFDQEAAGQRQQNLIRSLNVAPGYVRIINDHTVLTVNPFYRQDFVKYSPSPNPFSDLTQTVSQQRQLRNYGVKVDLAYSRGIHNAKLGLQIQNTRLSEAFQFGLTDAAFNSPVVDGNGVPIGDPSFTDPSQADGVTTFPNPAFLPGLLRYDLTRRGTQFSFTGKANIKQYAAYAQDSIHFNNLTVNAGLRYDYYDGISRGGQVQPRLGLSYLVKGTGTVLRLAYSRSFETPYNENLILSSATGVGGLAATGTLDPNGASTAALPPGRRNQFNAGFQQAVGKYILIDADYFWKYTRNAYDFNVILTTPITFPIAWQKSKIDGLAFRATLAPWHGVSAFFTAGSTRARFFPPVAGGLFFNSDLPEGPFRIDHDQRFQQTTEVQYQFSQLKRIAPYVAFTWRYESGLVAGSVPDYATALTLTPDQQAQIGLYCGGVFATPSMGLTACNSPNRGATRLVIPANGTASDDHNPPRIAPRNIFNLSIGTDNLFKSDRVRATLRVSVLNLTNKVALYNFLSTFGGTHFVAPRTYEAQVGFVF